MIDAYINLVTAHPLLTAFIQFTILGTLGEIISHRVFLGSGVHLCSKTELAGKMIAWGFVGIFTKYGFVGMTGFTDALLEAGKLPAWSAAGFGYALTISILMQIFFGPQLMFFHRIEDNLIMGQWSFAGMSRALWALVWFWVPAQTITFMLDKPFRIGLAAVWSLALGLILGAAKAKGRQMEASPTNA